MAQDQSTTIRILPTQHRGFAVLSGDVNPIHVDPLFARRSLAGAPVVHGMHLLLRALEGHFGSRGRATSALTISARFLKPAFVDEPIVVNRRTEDGRVFLALDAGALLADISIEPRGSLQSTPDDSQIPARAGRRRRAPAILGVGEIEGARGVLTASDRRLTARAFPHTSRALGPAVVQSLADLSAIVGMECPGRDSLLSRLSIDVTPGAASSNIVWHVERFDRLIRMVRIGVRSTAIAGTVMAFVRRPPAAPIDVAMLAARVTPGEFAGQRALIVGGSRGLGATVAALIAAGGGTSIVTYQVGAQDAKSLARRLGGETTALQFDVRGSTQGIERAAARFGATTLYYFATPKIFARRREPFDAELFRTFADVYVDGFGRTCAAVSGKVPNLRVFYPSSTAIDERVADLTEYAAAKAAGETLCDFLQTSIPGLDVVRRRLPRTATDQTASLLAAPSADPADIMLPIIRDVQRLTAERSSSS